MRIILAILLTTITFIANGQNTTDNNDVQLFEDNSKEDVAAETQAQKLFEIKLKHKLAKLEESRINSKNLEKDTYQYKIVITKHTTAVYNESFAICLFLPKEKKLLVKEWKDNEYYKIILERSLNEKNYWIKAEDVDNYFL